MENPLTGVELFIGTLTGLMGFGTADVVDRLIATHALTGVTSGTLTAYTDVPPTANPAQGTKATYGSLFNSTAVCAPMNLERWGVGLLISGVPILIGHFVSAPVGRSSLQFFGFGALMRVAGKGLIDMVVACKATRRASVSTQASARGVYANDGTAAARPWAMTGPRRTPRAGRARSAHAGMQDRCGCGMRRHGCGYRVVPSHEATLAGAPEARPRAPAATGWRRIRGVPAGTGFRPSPGVYNWGEKTKAA